jgi:hypothetical protein
VGCVLLFLLERVSNIDDLDSPASPPPDFKAFGGYWNATQVFLKHALERGDSSTADRYRSLPFATVA